MTTAERVQICERCLQEITEGSLCESCLGKVTANITRLVVTRLTNGNSEADVVRELTDQGMPERDAMRIVNTISIELAEAANGQRRPDRRATRAASANDLMWGGIWLAGGLGITAVTYAAAGSGGSFFIFWGPAIYGAYRLLRGVSRYMSS